MRDAKLSEGNSDKVVMWTVGSFEYDDGHQSSLAFGRSRNPTWHHFPHRPHPSATFCSQTRGVHPGANLSVSSTGEEPFQVEEAFWAIQEHECCEEGRDHDREENGADTWMFSCWTLTQSEIASRKGTFLKTCCKPDRRIDSRITITLETI